VSWELDHLVVAARSLDDGIAWCEATLGFVPQAGGKHPLMGTHNRIFAIGSARYPRAYFEIIAIDPQAPSPGRARWYDLDDPALQDTISRGPALVHWVAACTALGAELDALRQEGVERGEAIAVERATPTGLLRWHIAVRPDGRRLAAGALPTLIEWGDTHPSDTLAACGVALDGLTLRGLPAAVRTRLPGGVAVAEDVGAPLTAHLTTPHGPLTLHAPGAPR